MNAYTIMMASGWETGTLSRNSTYWVGGDFYNSARAGLASFGLWQVRIPKSGSIVFFSIRARMAFAGTLETVSHFVRINDATDVAQIDLAYTVAVIGSNVSVNQAVTAGDFIAVKIATPNWGVQPSGGRWRAEIGIQF